MTDTTDRPLEHTGPTAIVTTATALRSAYGYLYIVAEGGDGWSDLGPLTVLWETSESNDLVKQAAIRAGEHFDIAVEAVLVQVTLTVVGTVG